MKRWAITSWTQITESGLSDYYQITRDGEDVFSFNAWWVRLPVTLAIFGGFVAVLIAKEHA